jgi:two-component system sensor histidine kinase KdpD
VLGGDDTPRAVLAHLTTVLGLPAELAERAGAGWVRVAAGGAPHTGAVPTVVPARDNVRLLVFGDTAQVPHRVLAGFAAQAAAALDRDRLRVRAAQAEALAEGNRMRTALLAAVSHDLRTPLACVKASVSSLRQTDVAYTEQDRGDLLATIKQGADRLDALIGNLLDMSRLQTGALQPFLRPVALDEVVPLALHGGAPPRGTPGAAGGPPVGRHRPGPARARPGQPRRQRAAVLAGRPAGRRRSARAPRAGGRA